MGDWDGGSGGREYHKSSCSPRLHLLSFSFFAVTVTMHGVNLFHLKCSVCVSFSSKPYATLIFITLLKFSTKKCSSREEHNFFSILFLLLLSLKKNFFF